MIDTSAAASESPILLLVKQFYTAIDTQHWDTQKTMISNNFIARLGSSHQLPFQAWQEKLMTFYKGFPDGQHFLDFYQVEGGRILSVGRFTGTHQDEFMGAQPSGRHIEMGVMHLDRVINNKIVEHTAAADLLGLLHQIK
jgi:predicted ester cyclase